MQIASKLRHSNLVAYVMYMFQVEDVLRALSLDMDRVRSEYLTRFQYPAESLPEVEEWYEGLIRMMCEEDKKEKGHVQVVMNTILLLEERHQELLKDPKQPFYSAAYYKALPYIVELRSKSEGSVKPELETCLDAMYGITLLRMQGREVSAETQAAIASISNLLNMLAEQYDTAQKI